MRLLFLIQRCIIITSDFAVFGYEVISFGERLHSFDMLHLKSYLVPMTKDKMVYFVCFETSLDKTEFITQWGNYTSSDSKQHNIILQQSGNNGKYKYIAQYIYNADEFHFEISKAARAHRQAIAEVRIKQLGGYTVFKKDKRTAANHHESKVFLFVTDPLADLSVYHQFANEAALTIYQGYYENCSFPYILEFFIKANKADALAAELETCGGKNVEVYKECKMAASFSAL